MKCDLDRHETMEEAGIQLIVAVLDVPQLGRQYVAKSRLPGVETLRLLHEAGRQLVGPDQLPPLFRGGYLLGNNTMMPVTPEIRRLVTPLGGMK